MNNFSVTENINLFSERSSNNGYTLVATQGTDLNSSTPYVYGYGVVKMYKSNRDKGYYNFEMKSNIRGNKISTFEKHSVSKFGWNIQVTEGNAKVVDWAPTGTTTATTGGIPINVGLSAGIKNIFGVNFGSSFTLFSKKDTVSGYAGQDYYDLNFSTNEKNYDKVQHLNANVAYNIGTSPTVSWTWTWTWSWTWR